MKRKRVVRLTASSFRLVTSDVSIEAFCPFLAFAAPRLYETLIFVTVVREGFRVQPLVLKTKRKGGGHHNFCPANNFYTS